MIVKFIKENSTMVLIAVVIIMILIATVWKNNDYEEDGDKNNWYPYNGWGNNPFLKCRKSKKYPYNPECKLLPVSAKPQVM
jgi:hypothetical protein